MSEVTFIKLTKNGDFDGATPLEVTPDQFTVSNRRVYAFAIPDDQDAGFISADLFQLFSPTSPKLVGIAFSTNNPRSTAKVRDSVNNVRQVVNLRTDFQYVVMQGNDRLTIETEESTVVGESPVELWLAVNELNEHESIEWALRHPPEHIHTHFRIIRQNANFTLSAGGAVWQPNWRWLSGSEVLEVADNAQNGPIPLTSLGLFPRVYGAFVAIRYAGSNNDGKLIVVESTTRATLEAESALTDGKWSKVQYLSHEDMLGLSATRVGVPLVVDIEIVRVEPQDRLRARYAAGT